MCVIGWGAYPVGAKVYMLVHEVWEVKVDFCAEVLYSVALTLPSRPLFPNTMAGGRGRGCYACARYCTT